MVNKAAGLMATMNLDLFSHGNPCKSKQATTSVTRCPRQSSAEMPERLSVLDAFLAALGDMSTRVSLPESLMKGLHQTRVAFERAKLASGRTDADQGDLFGYRGSERFELILDFERQAAALTAELADVLLPLDPLARTQATRMLSRPGPACTANVTRLAFARPEVLRFSLYSAFDSDSATRAALGRLARANVRTLKQFVALAEPEAHALADPTLETWAAIRRRLCEFGLAFAITGEQRQERKPILTRRADIDEALVKNAR